MNASADTLRALAVVLIFGGSLLIIVWPGRAPRTRGPVEPPAPVVRSPRPVEHIAPRTRIGAGSGPRTLPSTPVLDHRGAQGSSSQPPRKGEAR
jgi:hypothetical protein